MYGVPHRPLCQVGSLQVSHYALPPERTATASTAALARQTQNTGPCSDDQPLGYLKCRPTTSLRPASKVLPSFSSCTASEAERNRASLGTPHLLPRPRLSSFSVCSGRTAREVPRRAMYLSLAVTLVSRPGVPWPSMYAHACRTWLRYLGTDWRYRAPLPSLVASPVQEIKHQARDPQHPLTCFSARLHFSLPLLLHLLLPFRSGLFPSPFLLFFLLLLLRSLLPRETAA